MSSDHSTAMESPEGSARSPLAAAQGSPSPTLSQDSSQAPDLESQTQTQTQDLSPEESEPQPSTSTGRPRGAAQTGGRRAPRKNKPREKLPELTSDDDEALINHLKNNPSLWNNADPQYMDRDQRVRTWQTIADTMGLESGDVVYKIYRSRRTVVSKVHRIIQQYEKSGAGVDDLPKVSAANEKIWKKWEFLVQGISHKTLTTTLENLPPVPGSIDATRREERAKRPLKKRPRKSAAPEEEDADEEATVDDVRPMQSSGSNGRSTPREENRRPRRRSPLSQTLLELSSAFRVKQQGDTGASKKFDPDVEATLHYLGSKLQSWSPERRETVEHKLVNVVLQAAEERRGQKMAQSRRELHMDTQSKPGTSAGYTDPSTHWQQPPSYHQYHYQQSPGPSSAQHFSPRPTSATSMHQYPGQSPTPSHHSFQPLPSPTPSHHSFHPLPSPTTSTHFPSASAPSPTAPTASSYPYHPQATPLREGEVENILEPNLKHL